MSEIFSDELDALLNLLAVIHRDGGHYRSQHGLRMAISHAEDIILSDRACLDRLQFENERLSRAARDYAWVNTTVNRDALRALVGRPQ